MKPKHHIPLVLLNIPFLLLSPAAHAQDKDIEKSATRVAEAKKTEAEKAKNLLDKEAAERTRAAEKLARETARNTEKAADKATKEVAKDTADREREATKTARETARSTEKAAKETTKEATKDAAELKKETADTAKEARERGQETAEQARERAKEARESGLDKADSAKERAEEARERGQDKAEDAKERAEEARERGQDKAENAKERAEEARERGQDKAEDAKERAEEAADRSKERAESAKERARREVIAIKASEPERIAESKVTEVTREVQLDIEKRKARIEGREQARAMYNEILGAESRISQAEIAREERFRQRYETQRQSDRYIQITPDQRRLATTYYQERLLGREFDGPQPEFFRQSAYYEDRNDGRFAEQAQYASPYYLNEGRRYVHYDSRSSIPAILMAALAMNQVRFQPAREVAPIFHERREVSSRRAIALPPENYRNADSWVVSYPVDEKSMISSEDILFLQGTTQFADPYSYEVIKVMADAMKAVPEEERFVIEGHASAEGSYESNMALSQLRAEHIVREIVRHGVSPYRLLPVGYGESEARRTAEAAESLRSQDRRVVVFRMKPETLAQR